MNYKYTAKGNRRQIIVVFRLFNDIDNMDKLFFLLYLKMSIHI